MPNDKLRKNYFLMKVIPISFDSLGVRSMCTFVETPDVSVLIDPCCALAPNRYGRAPHPIEVKLMMHYWREIESYAKKADVIIVTHYHYDHYNPEAPELFKGKQVYLKDWERNINQSQTKRASYFLKKLDKLPTSIEAADGKEIKIGKTHIKFSPPGIPHGPDDKLGCIVMTSIESGSTKFIHTSDVEGATVKSQRDFIIKESPDIVIIDGPLTWLGLVAESMCDIVKESKIKNFIVDHHFLRDPKWKEKMDCVYKEAEKKGTKVQCVAEYLGKDIVMYEPFRKKLFTDHPAEQMEGIDAPWRVKGK
jgi:predicted metallo-beta-lactamase superfamily hydrolase